MSQQIPKTSAHFRANLGVLDETAAHVFSSWAEANCSHHVMQEENGSTVLYATRQNTTEQKHKNALRALASNRKIKLKTEASFLRLLHEEYEVTGGEASDVRVDEPSLREATLPTSCGVELLTGTKLPAGFDTRAEQMRLALIAASA